VCICVQEIESQGGAQDEEQEGVSRLKARASGTGGSPEGLVARDVGGGNQKPFSSLGFYVAWSSVESANGGWTGVQQSELKPMHGTLFSW
jgi:hypothetical protein